MSIMSEYNRINNAKKDIVKSIQNKNIIIPTEIKIDKVSKYIDSIPTGVETDITFYDYDGTPLYAYSHEDVANLTKLPELPHHEGLIAQGWNWTLEELKSATYKCIVGANYITDDGKTRLYLNFPTKNSAYVPLYFYQSVSQGVTIDWGDGRQQTVSGTGFVSANHNYATAGKYMISLNPQNNCSLSFGGVADNTEIPAAASILTGIFGSGASARAACYKIELGKNIQQLKIASFDNAFNVTSISIPNSITTIMPCAFRYCRCLTSIVIPRGITTISKYCCYDTYGLRTISLPKTIKTIEVEAFRLNRGLTNIALSEGLEVIEADAFQDCQDIQEVYLPKSLTSIGAHAFTLCRGIKKLELPPSITSLTGIFSSLYQLKEFKLNEIMSSICTLPDARSLNSLVFPKSLSAIPDRMINSSWSLLNITLPENATSIGAYAFSGCSSLSEVKYPATLTSIGVDAFYSCISIVEHDFSKCTKIPTLANSAVFNGIHPNCKIKVPSALYNQWKAATNWSTYANYIVAV